MKHLMIDLETMGTAVNAPVVAIGAVFFDPETGDLGKTFDLAIDLSDAIDWGKASGSTIKWWMAQGDEARAKVVRGTVQAQKAFAEFLAFCSSCDSKHLTPWGNGATFDISILDYAIPKITGKPMPWRFWNVRDCRTILALADGIVPAYPADRQGVHHTALDDAIHQAKWVSYYWQALRTRSDPVPVAEVVKSATLLDI